jgi:translocation and assembly module TamB
MVRATSRALGALAAVLAGALACVGVLATAAYLVLGSPAGRAWVTPRLLAVLNDSIQGQVELGGFSFQDGGLSVRSVTVRDPDGEVVISADRAFAAVDLTRIGMHRVGARFALDRPFVLVATDDRGQLGIARAFAPRRPSPKKEEAPGGPSAWTVEVSRLAIRGGEVRVENAAGEVSLWLSELHIDLAGEHGPAGSRVATRASGGLRAPAVEPVSLEAAASLRQGLAEVPLFRARVGETAVALLGEWDLATQRGRAALLSFAAARETALALDPRVPLAGDLAGLAYGESDGHVATAAALVRPVSPPSPGAAGAGEADVAAAARLRAPLATGIDVSLRRLDPAHVLAAAPAGEVTLAARGRLLGTDPRTLRAALSLHAEPSRLRGARFGPVQLEATADHGTFVATSVDATIPGARLAGSGRYALSGGLAGKARLDASDLAAAMATVSAISGARMPALGGRATADLRAAGTVAAPELHAAIVAQRLDAPGVSLSGARLAAEVSGPLRAPVLGVEGGVAEVRAADRTAREVVLHGSFDGRAASVSVRALVKELGEEPVTLAARGALAADRSAADLSELSFSWPGTRFALARPARVTFAGPSVDRLELASDSQRLAVEGGFLDVRRGRRAAKALDARAWVERFDLARLPAGILPEDLGLAGTLTASAVARGDPAAPVVDARVELEEGVVSSVDGLSLAADGTYDGPTGRARVAAGLRHAAGGEVELRAELPVAFASAPRDAPVQLTVSAREIDVADALRLAHSAVPLGGTANADLAVAGTIGRPSIDVSASLDDASWAEYGPLALRAAVKDPGGEAQFEAALTWRGARALEVGGTVPLDTGELVRASVRTVRRLQAAPVDARVRVPDFDLALLAGVAGLPADLAGSIAGDGTVKGTLRAPRGELGLDGTGLAAAGWKGAAAQLVVALGDGVTATRARLDFGGSELLELQGSMFAAPESLVEPGAAERAPIDLEILVPGADLSRVASQTPLAGSVKGALRATGTAAAPRMELELHGERLAVSAHSLGDLDLEAKAGPSGLDARARLAAAGDGLLTASLAFREPVTLASLRDGRLARAQTSARLTADRLDLGFLPAALPGIVRTASGTLGADIVAHGPLERLRPQGTLRVVNGRASVAELGEWTGVEVDAAISEDALRLPRLEAHRGKGRLEAKAEATGLALRQGPGKFSAELHARGLAIPRAGQDLLTLDDVDVEAKGTFDANTLRADVQVPKATIKLPSRTPRALQSLDQRADIVVGEPKKRARQHGEGLAPGEEETKPYRVVAHVIAPNRAFVRGDSPRTDVELKADLTFDVIGSRTYAEGSVSVIRGEVEPIAGRRFELQRGGVTFTGGEPKDATLDVVARYDNPNAKVTVTVTGPLASPSVKLSSEPPLDESQIAMLIATGTTNLKAGSGGVDAMSGEDVGKAAMGAVATQVFKGLVADKLPLDTVTLEPTRIRAGKYLTDRIYVGYTRNFEANPEKGENPDEVQVQYQISSRWTFESRYGNGRSGGASLIWSKDY